MKQCPVCGREVVSKRKDAVFCQDAACRKKAHQVRKEQAAQLPPTTSGNKASVVVAFPDGSRWLLELTPLTAVAPAQLPSLTQVQTAPSQIGSGSVPSATAPRSPTPEISSEQIPPPIAGPVATPAAKPADSNPPVVEGPPSSPAPPQEPRTVELFFTNEAGHRVPFGDAVRRGFGGRWLVRRVVQAQLGRSPQEGYGLGGTPGRWREIHPNQSPTDFGLAPDIGVLYLDEDDGRTYAADPDLLQRALGPDWRSRL